MVYKTLSKIINKSGWIKEDISWWIGGHLIKKPEIRYPSDFNIGITTFKDRYKRCFQPLLRKVSLLFPDSRIIVIANGHVEAEAQNRYLDQVSKYCSRFKNIRLLKYENPKGLSHLWNTIIKNSETSKILILNDDLKIRISFREFLINSGILSSEIGLINSSWSHFLISREIIEDVGWFDEGLIEIGGEDDDYSARLAIARIAIENFRSDTIGRRRQHQIRINSYGKVMSAQRGGYSTVNTEYLEKKWEISEQFFEGAVFVPGRRLKYWKLKKSV